jgi:hypothetical protein
MKQLLLFLMLIALVVITLAAGYVQYLQIEYPWGIVFLPITVLWIYYLYIVNDYINTY